MARNDIRGDDVAFTRIPERQFETEQRQVNVPPVVNVNRRLLMRNVVIAMSVAMRMPVRMLMRMPVAMGMSMRVSIMVRVPPFTGVPVA